MFLEKALDGRELSPLVLAYIGDSVYDLYIRSKLVSEGNARVQELHSRATSRVNAMAQCRTVHAIMEQLTEEEIAVYKRGRNAKSIHTPKRSIVLEYRHATGLEALLGYLYVTGREERLREILDLCYNQDFSSQMTGKEEIK